MVTTQVVASLARALSGVMAENISSEPLEPLILTVRGQRVVLDTDLARLYGVTTSRLNESFRRNARRFPEDFAFRLTIAEFNANRSRFVTSSSQGSEFASENSISSRIAMRYRRRRPMTHLPWAFTEHGALMAANILRSERAVQMSVFVVRAFVRLREQVASNAAILKRLAEIDKTLLRHDAALRDVYQKLLPLLQPTATTPKRRIGFQ